MAPNTASTFLWLRLGRRGRNRVAVRAFCPHLSQGRPHFIRPTLGWRAQALWACRTKPTPTAFPPSARGCASRATSGRFFDCVQPRRGCAWGGGDGTALRFVRLVGRSQGKPHCIRPTLGWRAQALWACRTKPTPTAFPPSARGCASRATSGRFFDCVQPRRGCAWGGGDGTALRFVRLGRSQGKPHCIRPTLGWRAQALWACRTKRTPTALRPSARGCAARATPGKVVQLVSTPTGLQPGRRGEDLKFEI
jgi:hypothetical protein